MAPEKRVSERTCRLWSAIWNWWCDQRRETSTFSACRRLLGMAWEFGRESLPDRRRQRYGDVDYDWEHRVNTTGAALSWPTVLLGLLTSPYQPVPPEQFREMMSALAEHIGEVADLKQFTFIDIGSGKGRALLLALDFFFFNIAAPPDLPPLPLHAPLPI